MKNVSPSTLPPPSRLKPCTLRSDAVLSSFLGGPTEHFADRWGVKNDAGPRRVNVIYMYL